MGGEEPQQRIYPGFNLVYERLTALGSARLTMWQGANFGDMCDVKSYVYQTAFKHLGEVAILSKSVQGIVEPFTKRLDRKPAPEDNTPFNNVEEFFLNGLTKDDSKDLLLILYGAQFNLRDRRSIDQQKLKFLQTIVDAEGKLGKILVIGTDKHGGRRGLIADNDMPHQVFYESLGSGGNPIVHNDDQRTVEVPSIPTSHVIAIDDVRRASRYSGAPATDLGFVHPYGKRRLGLPNEGLDIDKPSEE